MTFHSIDPTTFLLYLTTEQLLLRGLSPSELSNDRVLELAREGLFSFSSYTSTVVELEYYTNEEGVLLFIHTAPPPPSVWHFADCNDFLDAVSSARGALPELLYYWYDSVWAVSVDPPDPRLSEFADRIDSDPLLPVRLAEAAVPLLLNRKSGAQES